MATLACAWGPVLGDEEDEEDEDDDEAEEDEEDEEEEEEEEEEELLLELLELRDRCLCLPNSTGCSSWLPSFCSGLGSCFTTTSASSSFSG